MTRLIALAAVLLGVSWSAAAFAVDVDVHGFFTTGYARTDSSVPYLNTISNTGSFAAVSDAGIQFGAQISPRLNAKLQLLAEGSQDSQLSPRVDLAEAQYLLSSGHEILGGVLRLPLFLISDYRYVGTLYPWVIPPPELYSILPLGSVGSNETFTGLNFINQLASFDEWILTNEFFGGGSTGKFNPPQQEVDFTVEHLFGTAFNLESPTAQVRAAYLNSYNHATTTANSGPQGQPLTVDSSLGLLQFLTLGGRWQPEGWLIQAEGAKMFSESVRFRDIYSFYGTIGIPLFTRNLLLHETYAKAIDAANPNSGIGQSSFTTGLNGIFFGNSLVIKLAWQRAQPQQQSGPTPPGPGGGGNGLFAANPPSQLNAYFAALSASF